MKLLFRNRFLFEYAIGVIDTCSVFFLFDCGKKPKLFAKRHFRIGVSNVCPQRMSFDGDGIQQKRARKEINKQNKHECG